MILAKHRNGALDTIKLKFISEHTTFVNLDKDSNAQSLEKRIPPERKNREQKQDEKGSPKLEKIEVTDAELNQLDDIF